MDIPKKGFVCRKRDFDNRFYIALGEIIDTSSNGITIRVLVVSDLLDRHPEALNKGRYYFMCHDEFDHGYEYAPNYETALAKVL